ncbi:hypothetical protein XENOCAPTIV_023796, partial [Xenoophorus captivus]
EHRGGCLHRHPQLYELHKPGCSPLGMSRCPLPGLKPALSGFKERLEEPIICLSSKSINR